MARKKQKPGPMVAVPTGIFTSSHLAVSWDAPANAVSLADLRGLNAMMAGMETARWDANDAKALGESQAKFAARARKKAGPRQRRIG